MRQSTSGNVKSPEVLSGPNKLGEYRFSKTDYFFQILKYELL